MDVIGIDYSVFSIEPGSPVAWYEGSGQNGRVKLNNMIYWHVLSPATMPNFTFVNQVTTIPYNTHFTDMYSGLGFPVHLHLSEHVNGGDNPMIDYLDGDGTNGLIDNVPPEIMHLNFYKNGYEFFNSAPIVLNTNVNGNSKLIYNYVDIVTRVRDDGIESDGSGNANRNLAPNKISYEFFDRHGISVDGGPVSNIDFTDFSDNAFAKNVFGPGSTLSEFHYCLTSHIHTSPADRYWNTCLRQGVTEDWSGDQNLLSPIVFESQYPDDVYEVEIKAYDVDSDSSFNETTYDSDPVTPEIENTTVVVDNFLPFVRKLSIWQTIDDVEYIVYSKEWIWDESDETLCLVDNLAGLSPYIIGVFDSRFVIETSEPLINPTIQLGSPSNGHNFVLDPIDATDKVFEKSIGRDDWPFTLFGVNTQSFIQISATDLAGNPLWDLSGNDCYSSSEVPKRDSEGNFTGSANTGPDNVHFVGIDPCYGTHLTYESNFWCNGDGSFTILLSQIEGGNPYDFGYAPTPTSSCIQTGTWGYNDNLGHYFSNTCDAADASSNGTFTIEVFDQYGCFFEIEYDISDCTLIPQETCYDGIQNQDELNIDCGGTSCPPCPSCFDGVLNQDETDVDCGGACQPCPSCLDGVQNQGETAIDCGGPCLPCGVVGPPVFPSPCQARLMWRPNPFRDFLVLRYRLPAPIFCTSPTISANNQWFISVRNALTGTEVYQSGVRNTGGQIRIQTSSWQPGLYIAKLFDMQGSIVQIRGIKI